MVSCYRERAYSARFKEKYQTYKDVCVCDDWLKFLTFKQWMEQQPWEGMQLDKDIFIQGNKIYSPETCVFVPSRINNLLLGSGAARGAFPIGVTLSKKGFKIYKSLIKKIGVNKTLGYFSAPMEAHHAWQLAKADIIEETVSWWASAPEVKNSFNTRAADSLLQRAWQLRLDASMGVETTSL